VSRVTEIFVSTFLCVAFAKLVSLLFVELKYRKEKFKHLAAFHAACDHSSESRARAKHLQQVMDSAYKSAVFVRKFGFGLLS